MKPTGPAVVIAGRDGRLVAQNESAALLVGSGVGDYCWDRIGGLRGADGLPCQYGCVLRLLDQAEATGVSTPFRFREEPWELTCVKTGQVATCVLNRRGRRLPRVWERLTSRERTILWLIAAGETTTSIADELGISAATVRSHVENMRTKLDVPTRAALVAKGFRLGVLD